MMTRSSYYQIPFLLVAALLSGCATVDKAIIAGTTNGPRELFIALQNDPLLISIELKTQLAARGYEVALNTEEANKALVQGSNNGSVIYKSASDSHFRYELTLGYMPFPKGERIQLIAASLRDRKENKILGTYRWTWNDMGFSAAPTIEGAIEMLDKALLSQIFK